MYKDVCKRISAFMLTVCLIVTMVEWPTTVWAGQGTVNTYRNGDGVLAEAPCENQAVAAVFTADRNADGAELLDSIDFYAHVDDGGKATATVEYYKDVKGMAPDAGTRIFQKEVSVKEGKNTYSAGLANQVMDNGSRFSVIVRLSGASFYVYGGTAEGESYILGNAGWQDMYTANGRCAAVIAYTYDVTATSGRSSSNAADQAALQSSNVKQSAAVALNKNSMTIGEGWTDQDLTLQNATGTVTWVSGNETVAKVSSTGNPATIEGIAVGSTTITATYAGKSYTCNLTVTPNLSEDAVTVSPENPVYNGGQQIPSVAVQVGDTILKENDQYQLSYSQMVGGAATTFDPATDATVLVNAGTYYLYITGQNGYSGKIQKEYVIAQKDVSDATVEVTLQDNIDWDKVLADAAADPDNASATLTSCIQEVKDTARADADAVDGVKNLVEGTDYTISLSKTGRGITLTGTGNYTGERYCGAPRNAADANVVFDKTSYVYTGSEWTPAFQLLVDGETISQADYDAVYSDNVNVGQATLTITGKNSLYGTKTVNFEIKAKDIGNKDQEEVGMAVSVTAAAAGGADKEPVITATYNGMTLEKGTDYTVGTDIINAGNGTYRRVITGIGNYQGTYTVEYQAAGADLSDLIQKVTAAAVTYNGNAQTPEPDITWKSGNNDLGLVEGTDYSVTYASNTNAGTATITLQGMGTYGGAVTGKFTIEQADMSKAVCYYVDADGSEVSTANYKMEYSPDGADVKPKVVVKFAQGADMVTLPESDYKLTYSADTKIFAGTASVEIAPSDSNSNFKTGTTKRLTYTIAQCNLTSTKITASIDRELFDYTGAEIALPTESVVYHSASKTDHTLKKGTDYTVACSPTTVKDIGTYTMTITGSGNYTGVVTKTFEVTAVDIQTLINDKNLKVTNSADRMVTGYDGPYWAMLWYSNNKNDNQLEISLTDNQGNTLVKGTDYELKYDGIKDISKEGSTASVTITGKGKFYGKQEIKYLLASKLDEDYDVSVNPAENPVYTGDPITLATDEISVSDGGFGLWKSVLEQGTDYTVNYSDGTNADQAINAGEATVTVEQIPLEDQPTANGCYVYSDGATKLSATFTIRPKDIATGVSYEAIKKAYDGNAVTLTESEIKLTYNKKTLTAPTDYSIVAGSYANNEKPGPMANVTIQGNGNYTGTKIIVFTISGKSLDEIISWKVDENETTYTGERLYPKITELTLSDGTKLTTADEIEKVIAYDESSYADNLNAGEASLTVSGKGDYYGTDDRTLTFAILPRSLDNNCTLGGLKSGYTYTSEEITPVPTVQCTDLKKKLGEDDYKISYENNVDAGTATMTITGKGNYQGTFTKDYTIAPKNLAEPEVKIAPIDAQEYNGMAVTPAPSVSYEFGDGTYALSPVNDYTVAYANNKGTGTATVTVTGTGNFTGSKTAEFRIGQLITNETKFTISCPALTDGTQYVYDGSAFEPEVTVTRIEGNKKLVKDSNYSVTYTDNIHAGTATVSVEGLGGYVGVWQKTFAIAPRDLTDSSVELSVGGVTDGSYQTQYTGSPVEPEVELTYDGQKISTTDYTVSYGADHTSRGTVTLTATAKDGTDFTGSRSTTYTITLASIGNGGYTPANGFKIGAIEPQPLVDGTATPQPKLYYNGTELVMGTDYICTYEKNDSIGSDAVVILKGIGNYTGSVKKTFKICANIADAEITVPDELWFKDYVNAGETDIAIGDKNITFDDQISVMLNGTTLQKDTDYTLVYADNSWVGNAVVTIKGMGGFAGSVEKTVPIKADLSEAGIQVAIGDQQYTGDPVEAIPSISYYGTELTSGKHFVIHTYENNVKIGDKTASVTVIGNEKNGFTGTLTENFSIVANAGILEVSGVESSYLYRGTQIRPQVTVKIGNKTLSTSDYDVTYGENIKAGTDGGSIMVKGKNEYAGLIKLVTFDINPLQMDDLKVLDGTQNAIGSREYTGKEIVPEFSLKTTIGSTDYILPARSYTIAKKADADNTNVGTGTVVITGDGSNVIGSREVSFQIVAKSLAKPSSGTDLIAVEVIPDSFSYDGTEKKPTVLVTYQYGTEVEVRQLTEGSDFTVAYSNNINAGTATAVISGIGNYTGSRTVEYTITEKSFDGAIVTFPNGTSYPYMGSDNGVEPEVQVTLDGNVLTAGTDYEVSYQNNKACGTATVTVTGKGSYAGSVTAPFTIVSHDIAAADVTVDPIPNQAYTGQPVIPEVKVTCGDYTLKQGEDYTLSFDTDNTEIGTVLMRINGTGGFTNYRQATFHIASDISQAEVIGLDDSYPFTGSAYTPDDLGITEVRIGETVLTTDSYSFAFDENSDGMSAGTQTLLLIGQGSYGGTKKCTIEITPKDITDEDVVMSGFEDTVSYSEQITQNVTFQWGEIALVRDTDYTVTCRPAGVAGTYEMEAAGTGNYTGTVTKQFSVDQTPIDGLEVKGVSSTYTYTGKAITPEPEVWADGVQLEKDKDYTVSYEDNINAGVAKLVITASGTHYAGTKELSFQILRKSIHLCDIGSIQTQVYTGSDIKPTVTVEDDGKALELLSDYTLMYSNNRKAGTGVAAVAGKGNYTATKNLTFDIRPCDAGAAVVTGASADSLSISWTGDGAVTGYEVYRAGADGKWQQVTRTRDAFYTDKKLAAETTYSYKVRSYLVADGETYYGEFTGAVTGTTTK